MSTEVWRGGTSRRAGCRLVCPFVKSQLRLPLNRPVVYRREDFVVSPANVRAVETLRSQHPWPGALALVGPEGAGKTHLARLWARQHGAATPRPNAADLSVLHGQPLLIEDADNWPDEEGLFHLLNLANEPGGTLLLTARTLPAMWSASLRDLRSRLNALPVVELEEPDDAILSGVIRKLLKERNIVPADDLIPYLLLRVERSIPAVRAIVAALDEKSAEEKREVNRALAQAVLKVDTVTIGMVEPGETQ